MQAARAEVAEGNTNGPERGSALADGHEVTKAWKNDGVVVTVQVKLPVPTKQISEKPRGAEEGVFVCLGRVVLMRQIDGSVMLSKAGAVKKVEGWEASGSVLVMAATLRLKGEVEVEEAVTMVGAAVVGRLEEEAAAAGKAVMAELEALKEEGRMSSGKLVVGILDAVAKGEDAGVVLLGGAEVASHLKEVAAVGDCQTVEVEVVCRMVGVVGVVWKTVVEAGVLRVGEVGARDLNSKGLEFWDQGVVQAVRLWKS